MDGKNGSEHDIPWLGIVPDSAGSGSTMAADVANVQDSRDNVLSNRGGVPPPQ